VKSGNLMDSLISIDEAQRQCKMRGDGVSAVNTNLLIFIACDPVTSPRQSQRSRWKPSPHEIRYRAYCDELRLKCNAAKFQLSDQVEMIFYLPMPKSWSKRRKKELNDKPAKTSPKDTDNLAKAVLDAIFKDDRHVWRIIATKYWSYNGGLMVKNLGQ